LIVHRTFSHADVSGHFGATGDGLWTLNGRLLTFNRNLRAQWLEEARLRPYT
jgi:hypothetical protein